MKNILFTLSLVLFINVNAQTPDTKAAKEAAKEFKKSFDIAIGMWYDENFEVALVRFNELLLKSPENAYIKFILGDCIMKSSVQKEEAISYLETASNNMVDDMTFFDYRDPKNIKAPFQALKILGVAYRNNYEFDKAIETIKKYESIWGDKIPVEEKIEVDLELKRCEKGKGLVANPLKLKVNSLGNVINSKFPDYAPVITADEKTIIFTSRRGNDGDTKDLNDFGYYEDIYIAEKIDGNWGEPRKISENINTPFHEASIGLSVDGSKLLIYSSTLDPLGDIYLSVLDGNTWSVPTPFAEINTKSSEEHACFNVDGSAVYFSSDRKGGFGGLDIYKIVKLPNGSWSLPINLGPNINTEFDEKAPFVHPDGENVFFASNGHDNMGGYDIFQSKLDSTGLWDKPINVGYPINTTGDDLFYVTSVDGKRGYYASEQKNGEGEKDLYVISLENKRDDPKALTVMSGVLSMGENKEIPEDANIVVKNAETGEIVGVYKPNRKTGKYLFILPPGKTYEVTYEVEGYLIKSESMIIPASSSFNQVNKEINLAPIQANESIVLNNVFFDFDSDKITEDSKPDLVKLAKLLNSNKNITIEISGHTDSKGTNEYNINLSQKRAESVRNFVINSGVNGSRIKAKGYGSSKPIAKNKNDDNSDNPEGRQLNRRIELTVTSMDGSIKKNPVKTINVPDHLKNK